jgi:hypothetical protein
MAGGWQVAGWQGLSLQATISKKNRGKKLAQTFYYLFGIMYLTYLT